MAAALPVRRMSQLPGKATQFQRLLCVFGVGQSNQTIGNIVRPILNLKIHDGGLQTGKVSRRDSNKRLTHIAYTNVFDV